METGCPGNEVNIERTCASRVSGADGNVTAVGVATRCSRDTELLNVFRISR